ncbi:O-succinylbenzoate synthase [Spinactinospora alkalitolerans]|uniref:O-succinylbenzoate synthase n=1 Tax=Spinactinospora alkalitolerans TaxID=687207 RepID=A0A852TZU8_9ACTN|nr:enolase C-terminal domain-like protein [Spinactinospora alkalitolerans]NYE48835.1 O-succinylbenzoate synthase [Spinactinospora alkalitolerans]
MSRTEPATLPRVAAVDATRVRLPLAHPKPRNRGIDERPRFAEHILVRVADDAGTTGWGEITAADPGRWRALVEDFAPALLRHAWQRPTDVAGAWADLPSLPAVESGLDIACWDLWSRQRATPLSHALGGTRTAITAGVTLGRQPTSESLVHEVNRQVGSGFRRIRLEIEPGWDVDVVRAVQEAYPFLVLQVDARGRYTEDPAHLEALRALDDYGLLAIEQPFAGGDLAAHARLRRELRTPLALDAGIDSLETLDEAIQMEAGSVLNLRVARMGGLTPARRAHDRAVDAGWQVWCGSDLESGIGRAATVALASLPGVSLPSEMPGAGGRFTRDVVSPPVRAHDGITPIPLTQPGLGHTVDEKAVRAMAVETVTLNAP